MVRGVRWLGLLIGIAVLLAVLHNADLPGAWGQIRTLRWRFGVILFFYAVIFGLDTLGWQFALRQDSQHRVSWMRLFWTRLAGEAVNYITPTASLGGEPVKAYLLSKRYGVPVADGMASVVVAKTTFTLSMFLFIVTGLIVVAFSAPLHGTVLKWVWITLPALVLLFLFFVAVQFLEPFRHGAGLAARLAPAWLSHLSAKVQHWDRTLIDLYRQSPSRVLLSLGWHFLGWMAGIGEVYLILKFLGAPVTFLTAWALEALWVLLRSSAFMIPGSLGASEGFLLLVCFGLGINLVSGLALGLVRRARELFWMGLGLLEFSRER